MFDHRIEGIHGGLDRALRRIAEEGGRIDVQRTPVQRRHAAIGHAFVVEALVGQLQAGTCAEVDAEGRVEAVTLLLVAVAEAAGVLVHRIHPKAGTAAADGITDIHGAASTVARAELQAAAGVAFAIGLAGDAVDHPTAAAAAEHHGVRPLQCLDPFQVVDVADVLHVVADAVDEEVGGRTVAAQHRGVAVAFALRHPDPRHVAEGVCQPGDGLVCDELVGDHGDGLGDVQQGCFGPGGAARLAGRIVGQVALGHYLNPVEVGRRALVIGRVGARGLRQWRGEGKQGKGQGMA